MTTERTPQDVLRELRQRLEAQMITADDRAYLDAAESWGSGWNQRSREILTWLDKAIAEAPDSPPDTLTEAAKNSGLTSGNLRRGPRYGGFMPFGDERTPGEPVAPDTLSEKPGLDVDLAAMRKVEEMLDTYLDAEEAARASNDVVAKLRLAGFVISRSGSTDSEGR